MAPTWAVPGLFFKTDSKRRNFVQFVQLNECLGNASKLLQRVPFYFLLFKHNSKPDQSEVSPLSIFFGTFRQFFPKIFFCLQRVPLRFLFPHVIAGIKRYIRTILRFSKEEAEVRKQYFMVFHVNVIRIF